LSPPPAVQEQEQDQDLDRRESGDVSAGFIDGFEVESLQHRPHQRAREAVEGRGWRTSERLSGRKALRLWLGATARVPGWAQEL
jgi:hypothetical protein